jgi:hypothetical protein
MTVKELKEFLESLPEEFDGFGVINGEYGELPSDDEDNLVYRLDKPISVIYVDEQTEELALLNQTEEEINGMFDEDIV